MLLTDATEALGVLDADRLGFIADKLQVLLTSQTSLRSTREIAARQRVFASVLRATGDNIAVLERVSGEGTVWGR